MEFSWNAPVFCGEEKCGRLSQVAIHPGLRKATHIVVDLGTRFDCQEHVLPLAWVRAATAQGLVLTGAPEMLAQSQPLRSTRMRVVWQPDVPYGRGASLPWPYAVVEEEEQLLNIPKGEALLSHDVVVVSAGGKPVGKIAELIVDPDNKAITHLLLGDGPFWAHKTISVPASAIQTIEQGMLILSFNSLGLSEGLDHPGRQPGY